MGRPELSKPLSLARPSSPKSAYSLVPPAYPNAPCKSTPRPTFGALIHPQNSYTQPAYPNQHNPPQPIASNLSPLYPHPRTNPNPQNTTASPTNHITSKHQNRPTARNHKTAKNHGTKPHPASFIRHNHKNTPNTASQHASAFTDCVNVHVVHSRRHSP